MDAERRIMPNGRREIDKTPYSADWCRDKHDTLDKRMDKLDNRMWGILIMLFVNLGGIVGVLVTVLMTAKGVT